MGKRWLSKINVIVALYIFCICGAELMGAKIFPLINIFGYQLNASVGIFFIPIIYSLNDILNEVYGPKAARSMVKIGIGIVILILLSSLLFTSLPPATRFIAQNSAYQWIFGVSMRMALASLIAFGASDFLDIYIFSKIRKAFGQKRLWLRNNVSNIISQAIDTILFMTIAFYAIDKGVGENVAFLLSISLPYWILKCCASIIETPFVYLGIRRLKKENPAE